MESGIQTTGAVAFEAGVEAPDAVTPLGADDGNAPVLRVPPLPLRSASAARRASPLKTHDKVLVVAVQCGIASRMERITDWLRERDLLV